MTRDAMIMDTINRLDRFLIRISDLVISLSALFFLWPVMVLVLAISMGVFKGKALFIQRRLEKNKKSFAYVKVRSMREGKVYLRAFLETDRIPPWGRIVRRFHLDECTDLIYILIGKFSLVGPRPLPPEMIENRQVYKRFQLKPGWTGLSQLNLMKKGVLSSSSQFVLDSYFFTHGSFQLYLAIIAKTLLFGLKYGHVYSQISGLKGKEENGNYDNQYRVFLRSGGSVSGIEGNRWRGLKGGHQ